MKKLLLLLIALIPCMISLNACTSCTSCNSCAIVDSIFACKHADVVIDAAVAASCTETGLTEGQHCEKCGEVLVAQEIVPITHNFSDWETLKEPDCFFEGEKTRMCSLCGIVENEAIEPIEHKFVQNPDTKLFACEICDARILNGHLYAAIEANLSWFEAYELSNNLGGHLATITSAYEQSVIADMIYDENNKNPEGKWTNQYGYWLGGIKNASGWEWVTGEVFNYYNWDIGEPTNNNNFEWFLGITALGNWHTCYYTHHGASGLKFICEWELDIVEDEHYFTEWEVTTENTCYNAGEKYRICTHCGLEETEILPQLEHNFIFKEETGLTSCEHCSAVKYRDHIYKIFNAGDSWFNAYSYCENLGGHLVTITSQEEQTFIETYMNSQSFSSRAWIGAYSDSSKWHWVTDEAFEYKNWASTQPDNMNGTQFFGTINQTFGKWDDVAPIGQGYLICEWEAE